MAKKEGNPIPSLASITLPINSAWVSVREGKIDEMCLPKTFRRTEANRWIEDREVEMAVGLVIWSAIFIGSAIVWASQGYAPGVGTIASTLYSAGKLLDYWGEYHILNDTRRRNHLFRDVFRKH